MASSGAVTTDAGLRRHAARARQRRRAATGRRPERAAAVARPRLALSEPGRLARAISRASRRVAVKIGAAADQQAQALREAAILLHVLGQVIGVIDLDGVEAVVGERPNQLVAPGHARMRKRHDAARVVHHVHDGRRARTGARHEGRQARRQPAVERFLHRADVPGADQRARNLRAADRRAGPRRGGGDQGVDIDRHAQHGEPRANLAHARHAQRALALEERQERQRSTGSKK